MTDLSPYPGGDLVARGLEDLRRGIASEEALLMSVAAPRLRLLGFDVPELPNPPSIPEHALFEALERRADRGAHMAYNALLDRVLSFVRTYGRAEATAR